MLSMFRMCRQSSCKQSNGFGQNVVSLDWMIDFRFSRKWVSQTEGSQLVTVILNTRVNTGDPYASSTWARAFLETVLFGFNTLTVFLNNMEHNQQCMGALWRCQAHAKPGGGDITLKHKDTAANQKAEEKQKRHITKNNGTVSTALK